jgi:hypothetical protein
MADKYIDLSYRDETSAIAAPKQVTATITGATAADPVVITAANDFTDGDIVAIDGVVGMVELNDNTYTVASASATTFALSGIDGALFTEYTSGGIATKLMSTTGNIRVIYDDTVGPDVLYDAVRRAAEKFAALGQAL